MLLTEPLSAPRTRAATREFGALVSRQEDLTPAMLPVTAVLIGAVLFAINVVITNPHGTAARVAAFLPPFSPMVVPARMVLGDMNAFELAIAVILELLATDAVILLAAHIYERAILRIGAPVKLRDLLAIRSPENQPAHERPQRMQSRKTLGIKNAEQSNTETRLSPLADRGLRMTALALVCAGFAGTVIGFSQAITIVPVAVGLLLLVLQRSLKHWPHKPAH